MRLTQLISTLCMIVFWGIVAGCAHYPTNPRLTTTDPTTGYRYQFIRGKPNAERPFIMLSFSGGGTRAAAFSFGLMEELRSVEYTTHDGTKRNLLDDIEIISSVSGGSFTSAYYALFPEQFFTDFPDAVLYRDIQGELFGMLFNPYNWLRLASPDFSRIDMADEYYDETIFRHKTFADLTENRARHVPFVVMNSTDIGINHRFEFTQDQFDLMCADLSKVSVSRAVAASSNFPVAFPPMTLDIYKNHCGAQPDWVNNALADDNYSDRRLVVDAKAAASYQKEDRQYVHLLDGGLSDNLGLRGPYQAVTTPSSAWSILKLTNLQQLKSLMVIAVNAKTTKHKDWDRSSRPPSIKDVLGVVANGPMDDVSLDSVEMVDNHFTSMKQLAKTVASCNNKLSENCPSAKRIRNPIGTEFNFTELSFDKINDPLTRKCMQELPTSFNLSRDTVDLLRQVAAQLLMTSDSFMEGMQQIDPNWRPHNVTVDQGLVAKVCKK